MPGDAYNYGAYGFEMDDPELERWQAEGPHPGDPAPGFELATVDGTAVRLADLRGRPVVLEFGSYTCPIFCGHMAAMEKLADAHPGTTFLVVYVREAHPGEKVGPHQSDEDKRVRARQLVRGETIRRPVLVDDIDGGAHRAYGGGWNPVFVLDEDGRVVLRRFWNDPVAVEAVVEALASGELTPSEAFEFSPPSPRGPAGFEFLERGGVDALMDFYRSVPREQRAWLEASESEAVRSVLADAAGAPADVK